MKESQIASMEEFIDNVKIIINTLGYKVLEPVPHADEKQYICIVKEVEQTPKDLLVQEDLQF